MFNMIPATDFIDHVHSPMCKCRPDMHLDDDGILFLTHYSCEYDNDFLCHLFHVDDSGEENLGPWILHRDLQKGGN